MSEKESYKIYLDESGKEFDDELYGMMREHIADSVLPGLKFKLRVDLFDAFNELTDLFNSIANAVHFSHCK